MTPEVDGIKADLLRCRRHVDVNECYNSHREAMRELWKAGGDLRVMFLQIKNLRDYQISMIKNGWINDQTNR